MTHTLDERVGHIERMVSALHGKINSLLRAANLTIELEFSQMADFTQLIEKVEKTRGLAASTNVFVQGLKKQLEDLAAGMDAEDQAKVLALAADLDGIANTLPQALASGGSMGGIEA